MAESFIHKTAEVSPKARVGKGAKVWNYCQVREGAVVGDNCVLGKNVYVDFGVKMGRNCKVQNNASLFHGAVLGNGVFVGPHCVLANDKRPRACTPDMVLKAACDWKEAGVRLGDGCSLGAGTIVLPGVTIGKWAMVGAGSVVTKNVQPHALVYGNPAKRHGWVCKCGCKLDAKKKCPKCGFKM